MKTLWSKQAKTTEAEWRKLVDDLQVQRDDLRQRVADQLHQLKDAKERRSTAEQTAETLRKTCTQLKASLDAGTGRLADRLQALSGVLSVLGVAPKPYEEIQRDTSSVHHWFRRAGVHVQSHDLGERTIVLTFREEPRASKEID